ncbi:spermatogeneis-associated protein 31 [Cricetulus griseus]|nr:spermatogeneis-associated protein 31 [Cricetulus griseus]
MTSEKLEALEKLVQEQLEAGHIEASTSFWNSPVFLIKMKSARTSSPILKIYGKSRQPYLVPDFRGITLSSSPFSLRLAFGLQYIDFIFLSMDTSWLTPSFTTWAMDMILAFVCGLGVFHLLLPYLPDISPSPQPAEHITAKMTSNVYLSFGDSGDDSISTTASVLLETFQQAPEETVMKGDSPVESTQNSPPALQLEDLTATPHSDNSIPSEASTTIQEDSSTALSTRQDLIGRAWHHNNVLKSSLGNPEPIPDLVRGMCQSPGNEYGSSRDKYQGARNNSSASLSPSSRNTRELEEVEEEDSCELALTKPARELGNSSSNNKHLRDFGSLKITEISPSRTIDHMPEASGQRTRRCLAPPVVLQDCATGVFLQDCAPEVLLAADIMASRASQSSSKTKSTTRTSISQDSNGAIEV